MKLRSLYTMAGCGIALAVAPLRAAGPIPSVTVSSSHATDVSRDDYRNHLEALTTLVAACAKARDIPTCDPMKVGSDDRVPLSDAPNAERRLIRYGWLRVLLSKAQEKEGAAIAPKATDALKDAPVGDDALPAPPSTSQMLDQAKLRLAHDLKQADAAPGTATAHAGERQKMQEILAGRDFRNLEPPTPRDSFLEKIINWLNNLFNRMAEISSRAAWIGRVVIYGFILVVCVGLVWGLIQAERRWRIRLVPDDLGPAAGAASARDWQLWLEDARKAAAAGQWREAIHFVYWASISRLESRRLWPADRARTPREYLALLAPEDPRRMGLSTLTRSFEHTWYGGRAAIESDYRSAEQLANALISGNAAPAANTRGSAK